LINHALGGKALAGPLKSAIRVSAAQIPLSTQAPDRRGQTSGIIFVEVQDGVAPYLPECGNVVGDDGAASKRGFHRRHIKRLIA